MGSFRSGMSIVNQIHQAQHASSASSRSIVIRPEPSSRFAADPSFCPDRLSKTRVSRLIGQRTRATSEMDAASYLAASRVLGAPPPFTNPHAE